MAQINTSVKYLVDERELEQAEARIERLTKELGLSEEEAKKLTSAFKKTRAAIEQNKTETARFRASVVGLGKALATAFAAAKITEFSKEVASLVVSVVEFNRKLAQMTGLAGSELDSLSAKSRGLAKTFGKDQDEITQGINQFAKQSKISYEEAFRLVKIGLREGADAQGSFLEKIKEFPVQFRNAGLSAKGFIKFAIQEARGGLFDGKLLETVAEVGRRLREMTPAAQKAIQALGQPFASKLITDIRKGQISTDKAFVKILKRTKELNLSVDKAQALVADLGGGPLEDLGELEVALENITAAQKINLDVTSEASRLIEKRIELDRQLAEAQGKLAKELKGVAKDSQQLYQEVQILVFKGLIEFVRVIKAAPEFIQENREALITLGVSLVALNARFLISKVAIAADTAVKGANIAATNLLTKSTNRLKNALKTNPFGVVLAAATALVGVYRLLTRRGNRYTEIQEKIKKTGAEATVSLRKENVEFNAQVERLKKLNPSSDERKKLIEQINNKYKAYLPSLLTEASSLQDIERAQKKVNEAYRIRISLVSKEKQFDLIASEIAKLEKKNAELNAEFSAQKDRNALQELGRLFTKGEQPLQREMEANEKLIERLKKRGEELLKVIDEVKQKSQTKEPPSKPKKKPKPTRNRTGGVDLDAIKRQKRALEERVKLEKASAAELKKIRAQRLIDSSLEAQKEEKDFETKKRLINNEKRLRVRLAKLEKEEALKSAQTESQKLVAQEKFAQARAQIERDAQEKIRQVNLQALQEGKKLAAARRALERNSKNLASLELAKRELEALTRLEEKYLNGKIKFEDFEKQKTQITRKFAKERLEAELAFLENKLATEGLSIPKRIAVEQKILDAKKALAEKEIEINEEKNAKILAQDEQRKARINEAVEFSKTLFDSLFEFERIKRDESLEELTAQREKELQLAGDNEQAKAAIEEKFRKKENDIKLKQAKADKAQSLFQIAIRTAENVARVSFDPLRIGLVVAAGLAQAAVVARQPLPKFHEGKEAELAPGEINSVILRSEKVLEPETSRNLLSNGWTNKKLSDLGKFKITPDEVMSMSPRLNIEQIPIPNKTNIERINKIEKTLEQVAQSIKDLTQAQADSNINIGIGVRDGDFAAYMNDQVEQQNITQERRGY